MSLAGRRTRMSALAGLVAISLAACGGDVVQRDGSEITNAETVLEEADGVFADLVDAEVDSGVTMISTDSRCYFLDLDGNVDDHLYCGPVRTLTGEADHAWYALATETSQHADGDLIMSLAAGTPAGPQAVDGDGLFRPDDAQPADVSALDEPQAPEAPISDFATLVETSGLQLDAAFTDLDEPYRLITPSATLTVEAAAELETVPADVVRLSQGEDHAGPEDDEDGSAAVPHFRPADGQQVQAWRVLLGPPPLIGAETNRGLFSGRSDAHRDPSTVLALGTGSQRLSISGALTERDSSAKIGCENVPCPDIGQTQYILITSRSADASPMLIATADGTDQILDLDSGELSSDVSQVSYTRSDTFQQTSTTWADASVHVLSDRSVCALCDDVSHQYGGSVQRVFLSPFAPVKGWAPEGQAWLLIPIADDPNGLTSVAQKPTIDWTASWTLTVGDETISHDPEATDGHTAAFLVDEGFTEGTFTYLPRGNVALGYEKRNYAIEADEELTLDISFPE